jgi:MFS superfamily sulfate permease-like transporter
VIVAGVFAIARLAPKIPGPLIAVAGAIAASEIWNFAGRGITVIGPVAGGLPHLGLPDVRWRDVGPLISLAASCFVMIVAQSAATARVYAARHHQKVDENEDLVGLAAANASAALSGTFVVNGSPTQTAMVESSGGQSQLAQVATAAVVALVLLLLAKPLQYLPRCVLGSIVFIIALKLIDMRGLESIRRESPGEYVLAVTTAAVVVLVGVEQGIVVAMILSLLRIVHHSYRPHTAILIAGEGGTWELAPPIPGRFTEPGLVMYRFSAALFYANAGYFSDEIHDIVGATPSPVRWLVVDAEAITNLDYTAARIVRQLQCDLTASGVTLAFARVAFYLQADLDRHHLTEIIGRENIFPRIHDALAAYAKVTKPESAGK